MKQVLKTSFHQDGVRHDIEISTDDRYEVEGSIYLRLDGIARKVSLKRFKNSIWHLINKGE
tara:strand:+ start:814 stop:996 length:183 start_codon:yes stop_codon:yes gene_type:complete